MIDLKNASEIFDGQQWYYNIEPGSISVADGLVTFVIRWGRSERRSRIMLSLDQVRGARETLPA